MQNTEIGVVVVIIIAIIALALTLAITYNKYDGSVLSSKFSSLNYAYAAAGIVGLVAGLVETVRLGRATP